ncbi:MAG: SpoIIE family protein phosphatase [Desulfobacteraceae bacterium]|nr:SpoIIE family protein phosphatase [Desulfobacteraceae bacterium]
MKTLRGKFVLSIVAAYLIIGVLAHFAFYLGVAAVIRDFGTQSAATHALLQKNKILAIIDREVGLALKFANDPVIRKWSREMAKPEGAVLDQLESYRKAFRDSNYFIAQTVSHSLFVYNAKQQKLHVSVLDRQKPWDKWFYDALKDAEPYVLHVDYLPAADDFEVRINAVLRDDTDAKVGFAGSGITISEFMDEIALSTEKGIHTIISDRNGVVLAHENREFVKRNAATWDESQKATLQTLFEKPVERERLAAAVAALALKKSDVETFPLTLNRKTFIAAVAYMEGISWYNVVLLDTSQVLKTGDFLPIVIVVVLSLVLMPFVIAFMLGRIVLKPLSDLTEATGRVARGEYSISLPVARDDELGRLTAAFNSLTATVLDYTGNLEQKVAERTSELSQAYQKLREAQKQVVDSIEYARMVQASVLPGPSDLGRCLGEYALLNMPKDIVGGDSYYFRSLADGFVLAVIDCTGHGVPGALIAMSVNAVLNNIPDKVFREGPDKALCELNRLIRDTLHHFDSSRRAVDSGLDIGLCLCLPAEGRVFFAGANLSLYCANGAGIREIQGDRKPLGYGRSDVDCQYASHEVVVENRMAFYLTTDGILDQPGPSGGFGMGRQRFREMIASISHLPMREQEEALRFQLDAYRGLTRQRDDILLLGFTLSGGSTDA